MLPETLTDLRPLMPPLRMVSLSKATQIYSESQAEQWRASGFLEGVTRIFPLLQTNRTPYTSFLDIVPFLPSFILIRAMKSPPSPKLCCVHSHLFLYPAPTPSFSVHSSMLPTRELPTVCSSRKRNEVLSLTLRFSPSFLYYTKIYIHWYASISRYS